MDSSIIKIAGQIAGIGGIALIVFLWIFRDIIRKNIFSKLTRQHSYQIFRLIIIITGLIALAGIAAWLYVNKKEHSGDKPATPINSPPVTTPTTSAEIPRPTPQATAITQSIPVSLKQSSPAISTEIYEMIGHVILGMSEEATIQNSPVVSASIAIRNRQTGEEFNVTSDNDGKFTIMLPIGSYKIMATHRSYYDKSTTCVVNKKAQNTPCKIVFTLPKDEASALGTIQGGVTDELGQPVAGVHVIVKNKATPNQAQDDYSSRSGEFRLQEVTHGEYYVTFQREKFKEKTVECNTQKGSHCYLNVRLHKDDK